MAVPDGIWVVDPQGQILFNNKRMAELLGAEGRFSRRASAQSPHGLERPANALTE